MAADRGDAAPPAHGSRARYNWHVRPCRCSACKAANAAYMREHRAEAKRWEQLSLGPCGCTGGDQGGTGTGAPSTG